MKLVRIAGNGEKSQVLLGKSHGAGLCLAALGRRAARGNGERPCVPQHPRVLARRGSPGIG